MTTVSITQPSMFPWLGQFEKLAQCDIHIILDDVAFQKKGFLHRMRLKSPDGPRWVTVPLANGSSNVSIREVRTASVAWLDAACRRIREWYGRAPYCQDAIALLSQYREVLSCGSAVEAAKWSMLAVARYGGLAVPSLCLSSELSVAGAKSERLLALTEAVGGTAYLYGPGTSRVAPHYLQTELFRKRGIGLQRMQYADQPYPQLHGAFVPRLSVLDCIALCGPDVARHCTSGAIGG